MEPTDDWLTLASSRSLATMRDRLETRTPTMSAKRWDAFLTRLETRYETIFRLAHHLYGWRWDFAWHVEELLNVAAGAVAGRPKWQRRRDIHATTWLQDGSTVWAMAYLGRFAGNVDGLTRADQHLASLGVTHLHLMPPYAVPPGPNDGGYAVSSYRRLRPDLGTMQELTEYIERQHGLGRGVVLDVVTNHTADDHPWAQAAKRGEPPYDGFYLMFDTREEVDQWLPNLRVIFPDAGEPFVWRTDVEGPHGGRWVWSTFFDFQWDLDYRNPEVLVAMTAEIMHLVNLGAAALRLDATPFVWKEPGTTSENLPEAHILVQLMAAIVELVAPSVVFLSEAIVHPDEVAKFVRPDECPLGYNPLVMTTIWEALATGEVDLLADALASRMTLPTGAQWLTYLRSHDDIGWGFADEDATRLGIDPIGHRRFLTEFYEGSAEGAWATGQRFQENSLTGDVRISGTAASLAGLETALMSDDPDQTECAIRRILAAQTVVFTSIGIPMIFLGDEIGMLNDYRYADEEHHRGDNRWMHRPKYDWTRLDEAESDPTCPHGRILAGIRRLSTLRSSYPNVFANPEVSVVDTGHPGVLCYRRVGADGEIVVVVSFRSSAIPIEIGSLGDGWVDAWDPARRVTVASLTLDGYGAEVLWRRGE